MLDSLLEAVRAAPGPWVQGPDEVAGANLLVIKWGTIVTSLVGGLLTAIYVGATNLSLGIGDALAMLLEAEGSFLTDVVTTITDAQSEMLASAADTTGLEVLSSPPVGFVLSVFVAGLTLYGVYLALGPFLPGGGS